MATFTKRFLSGSTSGCGIVVTSVSGGSGTAGTIHECSAGTSHKEEIWLWAYNGHSADIVLSIEFGTSSLPRKLTIPYQAGLVPVIPGLPMNDGMKVHAFAGSSGVIAIDGFVNDIEE